MYSTLHIVQHRTVCAPPWHFCAIQYMSVLRQTVLCPWTCLFCSCLFFAPQRVCSTADCALPMDVSVLQMPVLCPSTYLFYGRLCFAPGRVCSTAACAVSVLQLPVLCPWTCLFYSWLFFAPGLVCCGIFLGCVESVLLVTKQTEYWFNESVNKIENEQKQIEFQCRFESQYFFPDSSRAP
jgi:hypothetical protein